MNHELLKKLKDAGFPIIEHVDRGQEPRTYRVGIPGALEIFYDPTLEELIDASGGVLLFSSPSKKTHVACGLNEEVSGMFVGSTSKEAVARLWLAQKEKDAN